MYIPAVMLGATAPVTIAGALAQINAECLPGLVIHQLAGPGAPFIYGGAAPAMDMSTSPCSYVSPELSLSCAGMIAMARWLNLPVFCTAGCSDAHTFDPQAGLEAGYSILAMALAGGNYVAESHTVENFKRSLHFSSIMNRLEHARWREEGSTSLQERANRKVRTILAAHRPPELPAETVRQAQAVTERRDRS